jgi:hypothetical protein
MDQEETWIEFAPNVIAATAEEAGVYRFVRVLWNKEDVGHLFYILEGGRMAFALTGNRPPFDWASYFIEEGYLHKIPQSDAMLELLQQRAVFQRQLSTMINDLEVGRDWRPPDEPEMPT